jgi:hypothetical protein
MDAYQGIILRPLDIEFETERQGEAGPKIRQRVFRGMQKQTAMRDDPRRLIGNNHRSTLPSQQPEGECERNEVFRGQRH